MIARVVGEIGRSAQSSEAGSTGSRSENAENSNNSNAIVEEQTVESPPPAVAPEEEQKQKSAQALGNQVLLHSTAEYIAPQHDVTEAQEKPKQLSHRTHGGALPR
jgi:hypothetical protein